MKMDIQTAINLIGGAILSVLGWFARQLWDAVKELQRDVHKIEVGLPENYVKKEDFNDSIREIRDICRQIFDKIDSLQRYKADKTTG
jgi:hypothetical protein